MKAGLRLIVFVAALGILLYWVSQSQAPNPEPASAPEKAVAAPNDPNPTPPAKDTFSSLGLVPRGNVVAEQYGAVICPDPTAEDAFNRESIRALTNPLSDSAPKPALTAIWLDAAKLSGCNYIRPGTSLVSEGETSNSGTNRPLAIVTAQMSDGTAIRGVAFSDMLYSIPKGNVVANTLGSIICPDSKTITTYKSASAVWNNNQPNLSAEDDSAAAKSAVEGLAKSAGCNYVRPGTSLISEGGIEGGQGYGANLNLIVSVQTPDGATIKGLTLPIMVTQNEQPPAEAREPSAVQPDLPRASEAQLEQGNAASQAPISVGDDQKQAAKIQIFKGQCVTAAACDSVALIRSAAYKDYVMVMFLQGNQKRYGFSGRLYFDAADDDNKVMVDHVYSPGGEIYSYNGASGKESTSQAPSEWKTHEGVCEFSQSHGSVIAVECGQPMWSFRVVSGP